MNQIPAPDSPAEFRARFLGDPGFRDGLAQDSDGSLATLLRPLAEFDRAWLNYPEKKDQDVKFW
ncbi:hypothetical protein [Nakamurella sp.]|uniref:hypothetical protein n=1 Tax=Nakamurella sp. TaxID=1869182 RepID=UPI003B3A7DF7